MSTPSLSRPIFPWQLGLMIAIVVFPGLIAFALYQSGWTPAGVTTQGEIFRPPPSLVMPSMERYQAAQKANFNAEQWKGRWTIAYLAPDPCANDCIAWLYGLRMIHIGLKEHSARAQRIVMGTNTQALRDWGAIDGGLIALAKPTTTALALPSQTAQRPILIFDPQSRLVIAYSPDISPQKILQEFLRLIKHSAEG